MQKLRLLIICFLFPLFVIPDLHLLVNLIKSTLLFELKFGLSLFAVSLVAGILSFVQLFKFLFGGFRLRDVIELVLWTGICLVAFSIAKNIIKNLHQLTIKLLRGKILFLSDFQKMRNDWMRAKKNIFTMKNSIHKVLNIVINKGFNTSLLEN